MNATFTEKRDSRGALIVCEIDGVQGAARVFSAGVEDAKKRAEAMALKKLAERNAAS